MNLKEIKAKAKELGILPKTLKKAELIREIQKNENNYPCFGFSVDTCDQTNCLWRKDCIK
ncbi:MAG: hypothetical protein K0Q53_2521 [Massilibacillus sp.]|jgi:hypothetical protein|nr:hypothetical protein [Massilibacillus sp.]